jgi:hypothetical protein
MSNALPTPTDTDSNSLRRAPSGHGLERRLERLEADCRDLRNSLARLVRRFNALNTSRR